MAIRVYWQYLSCVELVPITRVNNEEHTWNDLPFYHILYSYIYIYVGFPTNPLITYYIYAVLVECSFSVSLSNTQWDYIQTGISILTSVKQWNFNILFFHNITIFSFSSPTHMCTHSICAALSSNRTAVKHI